MPTGQEVRKSHTATLYESVDPLLRRPSRRRHRHVSLFRIERGRFCSREPHSDCTMHNTAIKMDWLLFHMLGDRVCG